MNLNQARKREAARPKRPRPEPADLVIRTGKLGSWIGYGRLVLHLYQELERSGLKVALRAAKLAEDWNLRLPEWAASALGRYDVRHCPELVVDVPWCAPTRGAKRSTLFTMWETDSLPKGAVANFSRFASVIMPSRWGADVVERLGAKRPAVAPLGVDGDVFYPAPHSRHSRPIFGASGRIAHGGERKGLVEVAQAFAATNLNAELRIKCWPDCHLTGLPPDPRITVDRRPLSDGGLAEWYRALDVFVFATHGEGFGLQGLEAAACGVPVIAAPWSGTSEWFDESIGYALPYTLGRAGDYYCSRGGGRWAYWEAGELIETFHRVASNPAEARAKGLAAAEHAKRFTWAATAKAVSEAIMQANAQKVTPMRRGKPVVALGCSPCHKAP